MRNNTVPTMAADIVRQMHEGIREFGEYLFTDEGAGEIMDLGKIAKNLRSLEPATAVEVLKQVEALISVDWKENTSWLILFFRWKSGTRSGKLMEIISKIIKFNFSKLERTKAV